MDVTNIGEYFIHNHDKERLHHIKSFDNTKLEMNCMSYNIITNSYYPINASYYYPDKVILLNSEVGERTVELFFENLDLENQIKLESNYIKMWLDLYDVFHSNKFKEKVRWDDFTEYNGRYYHSGVTIYKIRTISRNEDKLKGVDYIECRKLDDYTHFQDSVRLDIKGDLFVLNEDISDRIDRLVELNRKYKNIHSALIDGWIEVLKGDVVKLSDSSRFTYRLLSELNYSSSEYRNKVIYETRLPFISSIDDLTNLLRLNNIEHIISDYNSCNDQSLFMRSIKIHYNGCTFQGSINIEDVDNIQFKLWRVSWRDE